MLTGSGQTLGFAMQIGPHNNGIARASLRTDVVDLRVDRAM